MPPDASNLFIFLVWLLAAAGIYFFVRWVIQVVKKFPLESDTKLLIVVAFAGVAIFITVHFLWNFGAKRSTPTTAPVANNVSSEPIVTTEMDDFVAQSYPNLVSYRQTLKQRIQTLDKFFHDVVVWAQENPHQKVFLQNLIDIHWKTQQELKQTDQAVDLSLKEFRMYYQTGEQAYVAKMFEDQSNQLIEAIKSALVFDHTGYVSEQEEIQNLLQQTLTLIEQPDLPHDPKNPKKLIGFQSYSDANQQILMNWLSQRNEQVLLTSITQLQANQERINHNLQTVQSYLQQSSSTAFQTATQAKFTRLQQVAIYNYYTLYQIFSAVEVGYLLDKLVSYRPTDTNFTDQKTLKLTEKLWVRLQTIAPQLVQRAKDRISIEERTYIPTDFLGTNKSTAKNH